VRIAIVGPAFPYKGGGAHHTTELARRLSAAGHDVTLESWSAQYPSFLYPGEQTIAEPDGEIFPGTRRKLAWYRPDGWFAAGRRMRGSDLVVFAVLSSVQVPAYLGMMYGLGRRTRTVALCHNVLPHEPAAYDRPLTRRLLRRVDEVLVHSDEQADVARSLTPKPVRTATMAPHLPVPGAARTEAGAARTEAGAARTEAGVRNRLLFFGMVRPYKGLDVLLRALAAGPAEVLLTVAGEFWSGLAETRALIASLGLGQRVDLRPGYVRAADVPDLFAAADALVLPYRAATASQNVLMAFEHGLPVIATRTGALPEHVNEGVDGLLCEPGDVPSLTEALKRFYAPGEPERLAAGVRPVDPAPAWNTYIAALLGVADTPGVS
jgi:glycosyltransferase involved in cell wall biosynthesis